MHGTNALAYWALSSVARKVAPLGYTPVFLSNVRLGCKEILWTNALAYSALSSVAKKRCSTQYSPVVLSNVRLGCKKFKGQTL
jgi:hypothetical protein